MKVTPPKGTWAIPVEFSATEPQQQLIEAEVRKTIAKLGTGIDRLDVNIATIKGEWQGARQVPEQKAAKWSIQEQYAELYADTKDAPVVLYLHGGAYIVGSIDSHRPLTTRMAADCGGRLFSVQYRLAPQHQFPAALIDALLAYKYLIDPPPDALHKAIDPSKIVIAGDSAGVLTTDF
jgi:acetyl esterase/lipase